MLFNMLDRFRYSSLDSASAFCSPSSSCLVGTFYEVRRAETEGRDRLQERTPARTLGVSGVVVGDRNYHSPKTKEELVRIGIEHQHRFQPTRGTLRVKRVWARDLWHLTSRLLRKVLSHTVAFLLNHRMGNQPLQLAKLLH
jgi:hypothetical protein